VTHAGFSPAQALLAGTRDAAAALGVLDQVGTVEAGKEADLLLVRGDPARDLTALTQVLAVYQAGVRVR
jgi:imidazolonepropionase-like amidohydrolase